MSRNGSMGPPWERNKMRDWSVRRGQTCAHEPFSKDIEETACHPNRDPGSPSSMLFCPGRGGWSLTKSLQPGARKPASNNVCRESPTRQGTNLMLRWSTLSPTVLPRQAAVLRWSPNNPPNWASRPLDSPLAPLGSPIHPATTGRQPLPTTPQES